MIDAQAERHAGGSVSIESSGQKGRGEVRIAVIVIPRARSKRVERIDATHFRVAVTAAPREGQANEAVIEALAEHFRVPRSRVRIVRGQTSRRKLVEVELLEHD